MTFIVENSPLADLFVIRIDGEPAAVLCDAETVDREMEWARREGAEIQDRREAS